MKNNAVLRFINTPNEFKTCACGNWRYVYFTEGSRLYYKNLVVAKFYTHMLVETPKITFTDCSFNHPMFNTIINVQCIIKDHFGESNVKTN